MAYFATAEYWDRRYEAQPFVFEWYQSFTSLQPVLLRYLPPGGRILLAGCGNSALGEQLHDSGLYGAITGVDFSAVAVRVMEARRRARVGLSYVKMDLRQLGFGAA
eukprot:RCo008181